MPHWMFWLKFPYSCDPHLSWNVLLNQAPFACHCNIRKDEIIIALRNKTQNRKLWTSYLKRHLSTKNAYSDWRIRARPLDWIKLATVSGRSNRITRQHVWISSPSSPTLVATNRFNWKSINYINLCQLQSSRANETCFRNCNHHQPKLGPKCIGRHNLIIHTRTTMNFKLEIWNFATIEMWSTKCW